LQHDDDDDDDNNNNNNSYNNNPSHTRNIEHKIGWFICEQLTNDKPCYKMRPLTSVENNTTLIFTNGQSQLIKNRT